LSAVGEADIVNSRKYVPPSLRGDRRRVNSRLARGGSGSRAAATRSLKQSNRDVPGAGAQNPGLAATAAIPA